jgi:chromosome condensin MukBEF ATPase and DNA-binding subunit MukB
MDRGAEREITLYEMTGSFAKTFDVGTMVQLLSYSRTLFWK